MTLSDMEQGGSMQKNISTPLGEIQVYADGLAADFEMVPYPCMVRSVQSHPPEGCFRVSVPAKGRRIIQCVVALNDGEIPNTGSSGERYLYAEFIRENVILTIGAGDEVAEFQTNRLEHGMEYVLNHPIDEVVFGVSWATDYEGACDIRTCLAADPLY